MSDYDLNPPSSIESEMTVLGAMIYDPKMVPRAISALGGTEEGQKYFFLQKHQSIYKALAGLKKEDRVIDLASLKLKLGTTGLSAIGGAEYLVELINMYYGDLHQSTFDNLKRKEKERRILQMTVAVRKLAMDQQERGDDVEFLKKAEEKIRDALLDDDSKQVDVAAICVEIIEEWKERMNGGGILGLQSSIPRLDILTGGYVGSRLYVLGGRPGMGKTSFGLQEADNLVQQGKRVGFVTLEMSAKELIARAICQRAKLNYSLIQTNPKRFSVDADWDSITDSFKDMKKGNLVIIDCPGADVHQICASVETAHSEEPLEFLVIDYLQLIGGIDERFMVQGITQACVALKNLARRLNIPVLLISQLSREVEKRKGNHRPGMADLRESGGIEQAADFIYFVYRESQYNKDLKDDEAKKVAELICRKNRQGPAGTVYCFFSGPDTRFYQDDYTFAEIVLDGRYLNLNANDLLAHGGFIDSKKFIIAERLIEKKKQSPLPNDYADQDDGDEDVF